MIKIRPYEFTDRYHFEKLVSTFYKSNKIIPPDNNKIIETISFYSSYPQCGKIYIILYKNKYIGYSIIINRWKTIYAKISYEIDELYIDPDYQKYRPEINLIEYLIKHDKIQSIEVKLDKLKTSSRRIFKFLKFSRIFRPDFVKILEIDDEG